MTRFRALSQLAHRASRTEIPFASYGEHSKPSLSPQIRTATLLRSYLVWSLLGFPRIVDRSRDLLTFLLQSRLPLVPTLTETIVRATFFAQFIPGETAAECVQAIETLRRRNIGSALNYSAEADVVDGANVADVERKRFEEIERALDVQGEFEQRMQAEGWAAGSSAFAVKVSGIISGDVLARASKALHDLRAESGSRTGSEGQHVDFPISEDRAILSPRVASISTPHKTKHAQISSHLLAGDSEKLQLLWDRLDSLAQRARDRGVQIILDAEETWLNPAIDGYALLLSEKYNRPSKSSSSHVASRVRPIIYGTYQAYLMRQPGYLQSAIAHANAHGYALGLKVVRGGYITKEKAAGEAEGKGGNGAVWSSKALTDASYNKSVETILNTLECQLEAGSVTPLSVIFGTHNKDSVITVMETLERKGLATRTPLGTLRLRADVEGRVRVAQLYGMREDLSDLTCSCFDPSTSAISMRFIAYGNLKETLPFLSRRAVENKSILSGPSGAAAERRRTGAQLRQRLFAMRSSA